MKDNIRVNVVVNLIRTLTMTILSFMTFPWVCRVLGDSSLGLYTWCNTFVFYFLVLAKIGIPNLAVRECVRVRSDKEALSNKVQGFFILQSITTILSFMLMCVFVFSVPDLFSAKEVIFLLSINFITGAFSFEWVFIALEKQFYISLRSIITLAISSLLVVVLIKNPEDIYTYAFITAGFTLVTSIINFVYVTKFISFKKTQPYNMKIYAKPLMTLCSLSFLLAIYNQTDTFILGFLDKEKAEVGSYSVGVKGIDIVVGLIASLSDVFIPRANYYYNKEDKRFFKNLLRYSINIALFILLPAIIVMASLSNDICTLIAGQKGYEDAAMILIILSPMMLTYSLSEMIYGQVLLPQKKEKYYLYAMFGGTVLNVCLSLLFGLTIFKDRPAIGVAIGTVICDAFILIYLFAYSYKWIYRIFLSKNTCKILIANVFVIIISLVLTIAFPVKNLFATAPLINQILYEALIVIGIDAVIYIASLLFMKEDLVYSFIKKTPKEV